MIDTLISSSSSSEMRGKIVQRTRTAFVICDLNLHQISVDRVVKKLQYFKKFFQYFDAKR